MNVKTLAAVGVALAGLAALPAQASAWEQIGYQQADSRRDVDVVAVRGNDRHRQLRVCVENKPLRMRDLKVQFQNGGVQDVQVRQRFAAGSCTRAIDLRGRARNIRAVGMTYDKVGRWEPAVVKVYAR
jgi:hypothetical protein